jgi:hypothetical protein
MLSDGTIAGLMWVGVVVAYAWSVWRLDRPWRDRSPEGVVRVALRAVPPRNVRTIASAAGRSRVMGKSLRGAGGRRQLANVTLRSQRDSLDGSKRL